MAVTGPFTPGRTLKLDVTGVSQAVPINPEAPQVSLLNMGPDLAFVAFGVGPFEVDITGFPLPVGVPVMLTKGVGADTIAVVCGGAGSDSATVFATPGSGL